MWKSPISQHQDRCGLLTEMGEKNHSFIKCDVDLFINDIYIKQSHGSVSYLNILYD